MAFLSIFCFTNINSSWEILSVLTETVSDKINVNESIESFLRMGRSESTVANNSVSKVFRDGKAFTTKVEEDDSGSKSIPV